jgi:hypothetical protein
MSCANRGRGYGARSTSAPPYERAMVSSHAQGFFMATPVDALAVETQLIAPTRPTTPIGDRP